MNTDIVIAAIDWLERMKDPTPEDNLALGAWLRESPEHVAEFLAMGAIESEIATMKK